MNKTDERRQVQKVFGTAAASAATEFERPDFLLETPCQRTLGVEVTGIYANNADAKLKQIPTYALGLIDGIQRVHRADQGMFKVEEATLQDKDGNFKAKVMGIFQEMPSMKERVEILFAKISEKEAKAHEYLQSCDDVDLIVLDGSNLFFHETHEQFYRPFYALMPKADLLRTPFREIYLMTTTKDSKEVFFPLLANAFIADCFAYEHMLKPEIEAHRPAREVFELMAACLYQEGHHRAKVLANDQGIGFFYGAWEMHYGDERKNIRDWMLPHESYKGKTLGEALTDVSPDLLNKAHTLVASRASVFAAVEVRLAAHGA